MDHLESNKLSELYQSAYKALHSTETALLKVSSDILDQLDDKNVCVIALLDLSAAFDTIDHGILLNNTGAGYKSRLQLIRYAMFHLKCLVWTLWVELR